MRPTGAKRCNVRRDGRMTDMDPTGIMRPEGIVVHLGLLFLGAFPLGAANRPPRPRSGRIRMAMDVSRAKGQAKWMER